jgi:transposase
MGNFEASNIRVQDLDHCGIVAGICDEMGLVEQIDKLLGTHPQEIISPGRVVKAMILNGLGFVSAPLYLFEKFFVGKATEHLLGEGIRPEHLNDDRDGKNTGQVSRIRINRNICDCSINSRTGIQQRWLVIESQARRESDLKQLDKRVATKLTSAISALKQLSSQQFACQQDALHAAITLSEQLPYHQLEGLQVVEIIEYPKRGRPRKDEVGQKHYQISATLIPQPNAMDVEIQRAGRFILATNVLDEQVRAR